MKHYLYLQDSQLQKKNKKKDITPKIIERYNCVFLGKPYKSHKSVRVPNKDSNKLIAALTHKINFKNNRITVLICNENLLKSHKYDYNSLFDPNKFMIKGYFYHHVEKYEDKVGYPLYEFYLDHRLNIKYTDDDTHRNKYVIPNIDEMTLVEYLKQAYKAFDKRILSRVKETQSRCREKL